MNKIIVGIHSIIKTFILGVLIVSQVHFAYAQTASILPPAQTTFFDANGNPLTSGTVEFFVPGQTTQKTTWQDSGETIPNTNPVHLDAAGRAIIWGDGAYRQVVKDINHNIIWDAVTASAGGGGATPGGSIGDSNLVGAVVPWSGFTLPAQYLYAAGQAISRTTYLTLYNLLTQTEAVTCNGGNATLTSMTDTSQLNIGAVVEAICVPANATIISKTDTSVTLSVAATISISTPAIFYPYGNGDGLTTFNIPDYRGVVLPGRNNMNGVASANLTTPFYTDPNSLNGGGGSQSNILVTDNLPPYTPAGTIANVVGTPGNNGVQPGTGGPVNIGGAGSGGTLFAISVSSTFTGTAQGGTSKAYSNISPSKTVNYIIKALANPVITAVVCANLLDAGTACIANTGVSGHAVPFLDGANIWSGTNIFSNGIKINSTAAALVGNATSSTGADVDFTISGLPTKSVLDANADMLLLWDSAANNFKRVSPGQIGSSGASGVTSLDGTVGAIAAQAGSLKVVGSQLSGNVLSSRTFAQTQNLSSFNSIKTLGYAAAGDGGGATFQNVGSTAFIDTYINVAGTPPTLVGGSGYTNGTYVHVSLTGGASKFCYATIVVAGGVVTSVTLGVPCVGYAVGNVLTTANSNIGGTGSGFTWTVNALIGPLGSFTDSAGNNFQYVVDDGNFINLRQFGAKLNWTSSGGDAAATNDLFPVQSAIAFASYNAGTVEAPNGGIGGGRVVNPKGIALLCGAAMSTSNTIVVPEGVQVSGLSMGAGGLKECATSTTTQFITLCDPLAQFGQYGCKVENMQIISDVVGAPSGTALIYSNSGQQFPLVDNVEFNPGSRGCIKYEIGKGGAANAVFQNLDCEQGAFGITPTNNGISLNSSGTQLTLTNAVYGCPTAGCITAQPSFINVIAGDLIASNLNIEGAQIGIAINVGTGSLHSIKNVTATANAGTSNVSVISLGTSNALNKTLIENIQPGNVPITVNNQQVGHTANTVGEIVKQCTVGTGVCS